MANQKKVPAKKKGSGAEPSKGKNAKTPIEELGQMEPLKLAQIFLDQNAPALKRGSGGKPSSIKNAKTPIEELGQMEPYELAQILLDQIKA